jgi:hypothetical protein
LSVRAADLADRLVATADSIIAAVEDLDENAWTAVAPADGRPVNVIVHHVALSQQAVFSLVELILADQPLPPISMDVIHATNDAHAAENMGVSKEVALVGLRANTDEAADKIRKLSDADLDKTVEFTLSESGSINPTGVIEHIMIAHAKDHLGSITAALA